MTETKPFVYDWRYESQFDESGNYPISSVIIRSDKQLTAKQALQVLRAEQERYKPSNYKSFNPVAGISHYAVRGWSEMYETILFAKIEDFRYWQYSSFGSEPTGKYFKKRNEFTY
jgi:hypothetical protein